MTESPEQPQSPQPPGPSSPNRRPRRPRPPRPTSRPGGRGGLPNYPRAASTSTTRRSTTAGCRWSSGCWRSRTGSSCSSSGSAPSSAIIGAFFAVLFTGRYPQGIFNFVVGASRWTMRVRRTTLLLSRRVPAVLARGRPELPGALQPRLSARDGKISRWRIALRLGPGDPAADHRRILVWVRVHRDHRRLLRDPVHEEVPARASSTSSSTPCRFQHPRERLRLLDDGEVPRLRLGLSQARLTQTTFSSR